MTLTIKAIRWVLDQAKTPEGFVPDLADAEESSLLERCLRDGLVREAARPPGAFLITGAGLTWLAANRLRRQWW